MNFQEKLKQIRELAGLDENVKSLLEKMTGKELVSYEGIDALVAALMTFYNGELKKKISVTEFNEKFKNFCPYLVGDIYITTNSSNPSAKYLGTTWQKIEGRFLLGTSNSQASKLTGGSMNKNISQANLPNVKLTVDNFSLGRGNMDITGSFRQAGKSETETKHANGAFKVVAGAHYTGSQWGARNDGPAFDFKASRAWTGTTNSASPQTNALGNGQALDITPAYYTTHMWLRTS